MHREFGLSLFNRIISDKKQETTPYDDIVFNISRAHHKEAVS